MVIPPRVIHTTEGRGDGQAPGFLQGGENFGSIELVVSWDEDDGPALERAASLKADPIDRACNGAVDIACEYRDIELPDVFGKLKWTEFEVDIG